MEKLALVEEVSGFLEDTEHNDVDDDEENFFSDLTVLCSERLNQMTKTYDDLDVVTKLLDEKEKDLELAAKIGKSLLERNKELQQTNEFLEEQFNFANEQVTQLKYELQQKIDLLHMFTDSETPADSGGSTPSVERFGNFGGLQRKLRLLEEENLSLKLEANHLKTLTQGLEEKEQQLLSDCVKQIADANGQIEVLGTELVEKQEQYETQQKQVCHLLKELVDKTHSEKTLKYEYEEVTMQLRAAQETQGELAQELLDLQERYAEVVAMLAEAKDELKQMRENANALRLNSTCSADDSLYDSLASELEASDSGYSMVHGRSSRMTYCGVQKVAKNNDSPRQPSQENVVKVTETVPKTVVCNLEVSSLDDSLSMGRRTPSAESLCSYPAPGLGVPGIPGSKDLEFAIRRLSLRRRVEMEYEKYRGAKGSPIPLLAPRPTCHIRTPSTTLGGFLPLATSAGSRVLSCEGAKPKIVMVKPVQGSTTLAHWKELATPGGIEAASWQRIPGVKVKGGNGSPPSTERLDRDSGSGPDFESSCQSPQTSLQDLHQQRRFTSTPGTFSYVTSRILHPTDDSLKSVCVSSADNSLSSSPARSDLGTATFSTAVNLAQALGERCVGLVQDLGGAFWASRRSPMSIGNWLTGQDSTAQQSNTVTYTDFAKSSHAPVTGLATLADLDEEPNSLNIGTTVQSQVGKSPQKSGVLTRVNMRPVK